MSEPDGAVAPGQRRRQRVIIAGVIAAAVLVFLGVAAVLGGDDDTVDSSATSSTPSSTSVLPSTTLRFDAPPAQPRDTAVTTTAEPPSPPSTEATTTTSTTAAPPSTAPPPRAQPGPTVATTAGRHQPLRAAVAQARARWESLDRSSGYVYRTRPRCFCPASDNEISVDGAGQVTGQRTRAGDPEPQPPSIAEVFDQIEAAIAADSAEISASFDRHAGFPVEVSIDPDARVADDETGRTVVWLVFGAAG